MTMHHANALLIPPRAASDPEAFELLRAWGGQGRQHVSVNSRALDEPGLWGLLLVDIARHAASAYEQQGKMRRDKALKLIKQGLDRDWRRRPPRPLGELVDQ